MLHLQNAPLVSCFFKTANEINSSTVTEASEKCVLIPGYNFNFLI